MYFFLIARVQDFDVDGNGTVDLEEFKHMVKVWFFVYFLLGMTRREHARESARALTRMRNVNVYTTGI
jgi:hypothetical protein